MGLRGEKGLLKEVLKIVNSIAKYLDIEKVLFNSITYIEEILNAEAVSIWELDEKKNELFFRVLTGEKGQAIKEKRVKVGEGLAGLSAKKKKIIIENNVSTSPYWRSDFDKKSGFKTKSVLCYPLVIEKKLIGVLQVINKKDGEFGEGDLEFLNAVVPPITIALENAKLYEKEKKLFFEIILALSVSIEKRDKYTGGHTKRVVGFSKLIAEEIFSSKEEREIVEISAILHDIGKIGIPDAILNKGDVLTPEEYEEIKKHPEIGAEIVSQIEGTEKIVPGILYHHERWDGKGYPQGLKGEEIPISARIIAVADTYDALTTTRPYRKAKTKEEALKIIEEESGKQFDPFIVEIFVKKMKNVLY